MFYAFKNILKSGPLVLWTREVEQCAERAKRMTCLSGQLHIEWISSPPGSSLLSEPGCLSLGKPSFLSHYYVFSEYTGDHICVSTSMKNHICDDFGSWCCLFRTEGLGWLGCRAWGLSVSCGSPKGEEAQTSFHWSKTCVCRQSTLFKMLEVRASQIPFSPQDLECRQRLTGCGGASLV